MHVRKFKYIISQTRYVYLIFYFELTSQISQVNSERDYQRVFCGDYTENRDY